MFLRLCPTTSTSQPQAQNLVLSMAERANTTTTTTTNQKLGANNQRQRISLTPRHDSWKS